MTEKDFAKLETLAQYHEEKARSLRVALATLRDLATGGAQEAFPAKLRAAALLRTATTNGNGHGAIIQRPRGAFRDLIVQALAQQGPMTSEELRAAFPDLRLQGLGALVSHRVLVRDGDQYSLADPSGTVTTTKKGTGVAQAAQKVLRERGPMLRADLRTALADLGYSSLSGMGKAKQLGYVKFKGGRYSAGTYQGPAAKGAAASAEA